MARNSLLLLPRWQRISVVAASMLYIATLLVCLKTVVHPIWGYTGFLWTPPADPLIVVSVACLALIPALYLPLTFRRPGNFALWLLFVMVYIPTQVIPVFASGRASQYLPFQAMLAVSFLLVCVVAALPSPSVRTPALSAGLYWSGIAGFSVVTYALLFFSYGLPTSMPGIWDVYSVRSDFGEEAAGAPVLLTYFMSWQSKVINPLLVGYGIAKRSLLAITTGFGGQLLLYAMAGHKSVLFSVLLVIAILAALAWSGQFLGSLVSWGVVALVAISTGVALVLDSNSLVTLFVRRLLMIPGLLSGYYHHYFSEGAFTRNLDPISRLLWDSPYQETVPRLIGRLYFDSSVVSANANIWADGYAAFGMIGMLLVSVLLGAILWVANALTSGRDVMVASILVAVPAFNATNSALFTTIGTHGLGLAILLLLLLPYGQQASGLAAPGRPERSLPVSKSR